MKKTDVFPLLIYRDEAFELKTKIEIQKAKEAQQKMLDVWNSLDLVPCTNLFQLAHAPQKVHAEAVKSATNAELPPSFGKFQLRRDVFVNLLDVPVPNELYVAAREARNFSYIGHIGLWSVSEDGKTIILDEKLANEYVHSQDIWIENEQQKEFAENVLKYIDTGTYLHEKLRSMPGMQMQFNVPFTLLERHGAFIAKLALEPVMFREILKSL